MDTFYTPIQDAAAELKKRWHDQELKRKVSEFLADDIPDVFLDEPHLVFFKNIMTPNDENRRHIMAAKEMGLEILGLEYKEDKFVAFNLDKYIFTMLFFYMGKRPDGRHGIHKKKIVDIHSAQGKAFSSIETLWGEDLIHFHHNFLLEFFPEYKGHIFDMSEWIERNGKKARFYYEKLMALFICHAVWIENFQFSGESVPHLNGRGDESDFTHQVVLPAFNRAQELFGVKPLIVQLAPGDYQTDPTWWHYRPELRPFVEAYINDKKANKGILTVK